MNQSFSLIGTAFAYWRREKLDGLPEKRSTQDNAKSTQWARTRAGCRHWRHSGLMTSTPLMLAVGLGMGFGAPGAAQVAQPESVQHPDGQALGAASSNMNEIVVTAQRVEQRLRDVPLALSAVSGERLAQAGVTNVTQLMDLVPALTVNRAFGVINLFIRGVGSGLINIGAEGSNAVHIDGVYIGRQRAQAAGFIDLERVEVLRGPQGTLYGRNATGGAVNLIARKPTSDLRYDGRLTAGNYGLVRFEGGVSGPVADGLSARLAVMAARRDGYGKNVVTGSDIDNLGEFGGRFSLKYDTSSSLEFLATADYYKADDRAYPVHYFEPGKAGVTPPAASTAPSDIRDIATHRDPVRTANIKGLSLTASWKAADELTFKSISGYRKTKTFIYTDGDGGSAQLVDVTHIEDAEQLSQEVQGVWSNDKVKTIAGLYYFNEKITGATPVGLLMFNPIRFGGSGPGRGSTDAYAAYGHLEYNVIDRLKLTAALRYSRERRKASGVAAGVPVSDRDSTWDAFTPRFVAEYKPNDSSMFYISATKGFKSGILLIGSPNLPVNPETIWSYEAGYKADLFDRAVQLNAAYFYYDYKDLQVFRSLATSSVTENAAKARLQGGEVEISSRPWEGARLDLAGTYVDSKFKDYSTFDSARLELGLLDLSGNQFPFTSKWTFQANAEQVAKLKAGELAINVDYSWRSRAYLDAYNLPERSQKSYGILNGRLSFRPDDMPWTISLWGRNLTDKLVKQSLVVAPGLAGNPLLGPLNEPRTFGIEFSFRR